MRQARTKNGTCSLAKALNYLHSLSAQCENAAAHSSSEHVSRLGRRLLSTSSSVAIVLIQFELLTPALAALKLSVKTDVQLFFKGKPEDRLWHRRAFVYTLLGYLFQRLNDLRGSLKFLYDAESLILETQDYESPQIHDLALTHSLLSFLVLFKSHKYEQAEQYVEQAVAQYNAIVKNNKSTQYTSSGCNNLYCLVQIGIEALESIRKFNAKHPALVKILDRLGPMQSAAVSLLEKAASAKTKMESVNVVLSDEFQSLLFITGCFPFISKSTPIISFAELNQAQQEANRTRISKGNLHFSLVGKRARVPEDYTAVMKAALVGQELN